MEINVGDVLVMKKQHPCGEKRFFVKRVGMDFKLVCKGCGHEIMLPRAKAEKNTLQIIKSAESFIAK